MSLLPSLQQANPLRLQQAEVGPFHHGSIMAPHPWKSQSSPGLPSECLLTQSYLMSECLFPTPALNAVSNSITLRRKDNMDYAK